MIEAKIRPAANSNHSPCGGGLLMCVCLLGIFGCSAHVPTVVGDGNGGNGRAGVLCEERPPGRATGIGNTIEYKVCIAPIPGGGPAADAVCELALGPLMRAAAQAEALANCMNLHGVKCIRHDCPNPCINAVSESANLPPQGMFYIANDVTCAANPAMVNVGRTASCQMGNTAFDCDCTCPELVPEPPMPDLTAHNDC